MDEKKEKARKIVKSIKLLEGVLKSTSDAAQKTRVKKDAENLRKMLQDMYPGTDLQALEDAIFSDSMVLSHSEKQNMSSMETLSSIEIEKISPFKNDEEINLAAGIMIYFEERVWGAISEAHTKLDFSNSGVRDSLYRKLDQCNRSLKMFTQTVADIERAKSPEYGSQLQMMRVKQGRVFLYDLRDFLNDAKVFISGLVADAEFGGSTILNPDEKVIYADYEKYRMFENWSVIDSIRYMKKFVTEVLDILNVPDLKNLKNTGK